MTQQVLDIRTRNLSPDMIIDTVARVTGLTRRELLGFDRHADIAAARHVLSFLLYTDYRANLGAVGRLTGRHHTTVMNSLDHFKKPDPDARLLDLVTRCRANYDRAVRPVYGIRQALSA